MRFLEVDRTELPGQLAHPSSLV